MEDVLTEVPPPSRFFQDDLNNFSPPPPSLPSPFLVFSHIPQEKPLHPSLLIIAISAPSRYIFHHILSKNLIGSLILPEIPLSGNTIKPTLKNKSCNIYSINPDDRSILLVSVQYSVPAERSHSFAKLLIGERLVPDRVLIFDSVQGRHFRGALPPEEPLAYRLVTTIERRGRKAEGDCLLEEFDYFPSGSLVEGLSAALLCRCEMRKLRASLCLTWPESGAPVVSLVQSVLTRNVSHELQFDEEDKSEIEYQSVSRNRSHLLDSELYT